MEQDDFITILEEKEKEIQDLKAKLTTTESEKASLLHHMTHLSSKWKEDTSEMDKLLSTMESSTGLDCKRRPVRRQWSMGEPPIMGEVSPEVPSASPVVPELRVVLLGGTCVEKQAVTEAILGREAGAEVTRATQTQCIESRQEEVQEETILGSDAGIATQTSRSTQTQCCECRQGEVAGRMVRVVKTPDWFSPEFVAMQDVRRCMSLSNPGPHAFIIIIPVKSIGEEERNIQDKLEEMFGETCWKHAMVLLTSEDVVELTSMEELTPKENQELSQLVERCGNRYHLLSLKTCAADASLLVKIEGVMTNNIDEFYCSQTYFEVDELLREMETTMQREKEQRKESKQSMRKEKEDQFKRMLQESLSGVERDISKHESDMKMISERLSVLGKCNKEERNERQEKEIERKLKRETAEREAIVKGINALKEQWEEERMKMEERLKKDFEEIQDKYKREAKVKTEKHFRKLLLSGFHKKINTKPMIQDNLSAVTEGMYAHLVKQMHKDSRQGQPKNTNSDTDCDIRSEE